jgi:transcription elongation factor Elf1
MGNKQPKSVKLRYKTRFEGECARCKTKVIIIRYTDYRLKKRDLINAYCGICRRPSVFLIVNITDEDGYIPNKKI